MQQIMIENKQKLSCKSPQNQKKNGNILLNHSSRIQSDPILLKKIEISIFLKIPYKQLFWLVGPVGRNLLNLSATINLSRHSLKEPLCKILAKSDKHFRSYAVFLIFGW